jgi:hypothetical protein
MYFFTHGDNVAPSLAEVRSMMSWNLDQRLEFSIGAFKAWVNCKTAMAVSRQFITPVFKDSSAQRACGPAGC